MGTTQYKETNMTIDPANKTVIQNDRIQGNQSPNQQYAT